MQVSWHDKDIKQPNKAGWIEFVMFNVQAIIKQVVYPLVY